MILSSPEGVKRKADGKLGRVVRSEPLVKRQVRARRNTNQGRGQSARAPLAGGDPREMVSVDGSI